jgi:hypothetical protein
MSRYYGYYGQGLADRLGAYDRKLAEKTYRVVFYFNVNDESKKSTLFGVKEENMLALIADFVRAPTDSTHVLSVRHSNGGYAVKSYLVHEIVSTEE